MLIDISLLLIFDILTSYHYYNFLITLCKSYSDLISVNGREELLGGRYMNI